MPTKVIDKPKEPGQQGPDPYSLAPDSGQVRAARVENVRAYAPNNPPQAGEHEANDIQRDWPAAPLRNDTGEEHDGMTWQRPPLQRETVEVLHSIERPNLTATFGTPQPPSGLSGMVRRVAFGFSENNSLHWISLILADRINLVEGVGDDLLHGKVPNVFKEMGLTADLKSNKKGLAIKTAAVVAVAGLGVYLLTRPRPKPRRLRFAR